MYSKIAIGNVRKSFKDYTIYFLTLSLAVCIFYSFNSMESQKALLEMTSGQAGYIKMLTNVISYVSVFISIILGSLILYANNFLIKKRNKELGIYMTLGMSKNKISKILIMETLIVGLISLVTGLVLGLFASQGLSVLVSNLFSVSMKEYRFVISTNAILKTILYFGIMFLLVMVFNTYIVSKYKIIDLLTSGRKNEDIKFKNPIVYIVSFILCLISLITAYTLILNTELNPDDLRFWTSIVFGVIGTFLFFFSLAGAILYIVKKNKRVYFKGLNIFVVKQINSKVNTNFLSMSIICLMLFLTIGILSTGLSFKDAIEAGLKDSTPYDASSIMYVYEDDKVKNAKEALDKAGIEFGYEKYVAYDEYASDIKIQDLFKMNEKSKFKDSTISFVKISDYNKLQELKGEENINLGNDEILVLSNFSKILPDINSFLKNNNNLTINNKSYKIKNDKAIEENLYTTFMENNFCTIIINDEFCNDLDIRTSIVNINYDERDKEEAEKKYSGLFDRYISGEIDYVNTGFVQTSTKNQIYDESKGMTTTILFVGIYIGIVFLISSMAVLALQQLSEASDSIDRYASLKRIGANERSINKTIFMQTLIYFSLPVILALAHSVVGIYVANDFISMYNKPNIAGSSLITAGMFMIVYIVYFLATYLGYKNIVKSKIK